MALDDGPTERYGPKVQGAGIHRNPTISPGGAKFIYGHIWVTLSAVFRHRLWGTIGLPVLAAIESASWSISFATPLPMVPKPTNPTLTTFADIFSSLVTRAIF